MPGYDRSRIVGMSEEDLEELICGICHEIFIKPKVAQCCGQTFCYCCINEWLQENNTCPMDRRKLTTTQLKSPPKLVTNLLNNMKIKCDFYENGCKVVVKINDLEKHKQSVCAFNPNRNCNNCGQIQLNHCDKDCIYNMTRKLNDLQKENDHFRQMQYNDQIKFDKLKVELDKSERLINNLNITILDLQSKINRLEFNANNLLDIIKQKTLQEPVNRRVIDTFTGMWKLFSSNNYDAYLKEMGYSFFERLLSSSAPQLEIRTVGDSLQFKYLPSKLVIKFKLCEQFEESSNGESFKSVVILVGNKLIKTQKRSKADVSHVREFYGNVMILTSEVNNVKCFHIYKKED